MNKKLKTLLVFDIIFFILASVIYIFQSIYAVSFVIEYFKALNPPEDAILVGLGIALSRVIYIIAFLINIVNYLTVLILSIILIKKKQKFGLAALIIDIIYVVSSLIIEAFMFLHLGKLGHARNLPYFPSLSTILAPHFSQITSVTTTSAVLAPAFFNCGKNLV